MMTDKLEAHGNGWNDGDVLTAGDLNDTFTAVMDNVVSNMDNVTRNALAVKILEYENSLSNYTYDFLVADPVYSNNTDGSSNLNIDTGNKQITLSAEERLANFQDYDYFGEGNHLLMKMTINGQESLITTSRDQYNRYDVIRMYDNGSGIPISTDYQTLYDENTNGYNRYPRGVFEMEDGKILLLYEWSNDQNLYYTIISGDSGIETNWYDIVSGEDQILLESEGANNNFTDAIYDSGTLYILYRDNRAGESIEYLSSYDIQSDSWNYQQNQIDSGDSYDSEESALVFDKDGFLWIMAFHVSGSNLEYNAIQVSTGTGAEQNRYTDQNSFNIEYLYDLDVDYSETHHSIVWKLRTRYSDDTSVACGHYDIGANSFTDDKHTQTTDYDDNVYVSWGGLIGDYMCGMYRWEDYNGDTFQKRNSYGFKYDITNGNIYTTLLNSYTGSESEQDFIDGNYKLDNRETNAIAWNSEWVMGVNGTADDHNNDKGLIVYNPYKDDYTMRPSSGWFVRGSPVTDTPVTSLYAGGKLDVPTNTSLSVDVFADGLPSEITDSISEYSGSSSWYDLQADDWYFQFFRLGEPDPTGQVDELGDFNGAYKIYRTRFQYRTNYSNGSLPANMPIEIWEVSGKDGTLQNQVWSGTIDTSQFDDHQGSGSSYHDVYFSDGNKPLVETGKFYIIAIGNVGGDTNVFYMNRYFDDRDYIGFGSINSNTNLQAGDGINGYDTTRWWTYVEGGGTKIKTGVPLQESVGVDESQGYKMLFFKYLLNSSDNYTTPTIDDYAFTVTES